MVKSSVFLSLCVENCPKFCFLSVKSSGRLAFPLGIFWVYVLIHLLCQSFTGINILRISFVKNLVRSSEISLLAEPISTDAQHRDPGEIGTFFASKQTWTEGN